MGIAFLFAGCRASAPSREFERTEQRFEFSRLAMGGEARVVLYARSEALAIEAAESAFATVARLEEVLSDWRESSELAQLTSAEVGRDVPVGADLFDALTRALDVASRSDGAFDPTVGPVVSLWRAARRSGRLPESASIAEARARVGHAFVHLDASAHTVRFDRAGMRLDVGGIGKGLACQRAIETLTERGVARALVQMGGDLVCSAPPPGRAGWSVDVAPDARESHGERLVIDHAALSNSGDREQHVLIDGVTYSHVVDPSTGLGLTTRAHAIVLARDGATADALSTALTVVGVERAADLMARFPGCEAWLEEGAPDSASSAPAAGSVGSDRTPPYRGGARRYATPSWSAIPREFRTSP